MLELTPYLVLPALSFVICLFLTPVVRWTARRLRLVEEPRKDRWHKKPTPMLGGIAIYCAAALPLLWFADLGSIAKHLHLHSPGPVIFSPTAVAWLGMTCLFLLGLFDDLTCVAPQNKLIIEIIVASLVAFLGYRLQWVSSLTVDTMLTIVWIVGITNATNMLDNMDGLCTGISLIAAVFFSLILYTTASAEMLKIALLLAGALGAFLIYNFYPASIFMGDSGSLPLGFALAIMCLHPISRSVDFSISLYAVPILVLLVPIFDTALVTSIRLLSGRKPSIGGKDHTSHRLVLMGLSERRSVFWLYAIGSLSGLAAIFVQQHDDLAAPAVIIPLFVSVTLMGVYLAQIKVYPEKDLCLLRSSRFTPLLKQVAYKRQLFHVTFDLVLVSFSYYLSYRLRFGFTGQFGTYFQTFLSSLPAIIICKLAAFYSTGIYKGMWRYIALSDVFVYLKATLLGTLLSLAAVTYVYRFSSFSKGVFIIDWFLTTAFLVGFRLSFRFFREVMKRKTAEGENVLIYGAGQGGQLVLREILDNRHLFLRPVGFIDDDTMKVGKRLLGYPIMGTGTELEQVLKKHAISGVIISCRRMNEVNEKKLVETCSREGIFLKRFVIGLEDVHLLKKVVREKEA